MNAWHLKWINTLSSKQYIIFSGGNEGYLTLNTPLTVILLQIQLPHLNNRTSSFNHNNNNAYSFSHCRLKICNFHKNVSPKTHTSSRAGCESTSCNCGIFRHLFCFVCLFRSDPHYPLTLNPSSCPPRNKHGIRIE